MTSAGTETTTISLPDATTASLANERTPPAPRDDQQRPERWQRRATRGDNAQAGSRDQRWQCKQPKVLHPKEQASSAGPDHVSRQRGGAPGPQEAEKAERARRLVTGEPRTRPIKMGLAWAGTKTRTPEPGARARALRSLVELARVARLGHVQTGAPGVARRGRECPLALART